MRDAISLFEQYAIGGVLRRKFIEENLALVGEGFLSDFLAALANKDLVKILEKLNDLKHRSIEARRFFDELLFFMRDRLVESLSSPQFAVYERIFRAFEAAYGKLRDFPEPFLLLEITSLSLVNIASVTAMSDVPLRNTERVEYKPTPTPTPVRTAPAVTPAPVINTVEDVPVPSLSVAPAVETIEAAPIAEGPSSEIDSSVFNLLELVNYVKAQPGKGFVLAALKNGDFSFNGDVLTFGCSSEFERKKLDNPDIQGFIGDAISSLFGIQPKIAFSLSKKKKVALEAHDAADIF
ncbi:MAG: hypothetical protein ACOYN2_04910 [Patescibacteria group bacterium]